MLKDSVLFFGAAGSGKGTQSDLLCKNKNVLKISPGDIIRSTIHEEPDSAIGKTLNETISKGNLVNTEMLIEMLLHYISKHKNNYSVYLFDGFPRSVEQNKLFEQILVPDLLLNIKLAILLDIQIEKLSERLSNRIVCSGCDAIFNKITHISEKGENCDKCGFKLKAREDDLNSEAIYRRFNIFEKEVLPVIEIYRQKNILCTFDALDSPETINHHILDLLKKNDIQLSAR